MSPEAHLVADFAITAAWGLAVVVALLTARLRGQFWGDAVFLVGGVVVWVAFAVLDAISHASVSDRVWDGAMICIFVYLIWHWWNRHGRKRAARLIGYKTHALRAKLAQLAHQHA